MIDQIVSFLDLAGEYDRVVVHKGGKSQTLRGDIVPKIESMLDTLPPGGKIKIMPYNEDGCKASKTFTKPGGGVMRITDCPHCQEPNPIAEYHLSALQAGIAQKDDQILEMLKDYTRLASETIRGGNPGAVAGMVQAIMTEAYSAITEAKNETFTAKEYALLVEVSQKIKEAETQNKGFLDGKAGELVELLGYSQLEKAGLVPEGTFLTKLGAIETGRLAKQGLIPEGGQ